MKVRLLEPLYFGLEWGVSASGGASLNTSVMCWGPMGFVRKWRSVLESFCDVLE